MRVAGIDGGITGAASLLTGGGGIFPTIKTVDLRTTGEGKQRKIDYRWYRDLLRIWKPDVLYFEAARAFLGMGVMSAGRFGHTLGALEAISACEVDECVLVPPQVWKRKLDLLKTAKVDSRQLIIDLFPASAHLYRRALDHNRADSALVSVYGGIRQGIISLEAIT